MLNDKVAWMAQWRHL